MLRAYHNSPNLSRFERTKGKGLGNQEIRDSGDTDSLIARFPDSPITDSLTLLYISPLKALNNDIERNLRVPLAGIRHVAHRQGQYLPELRVAVRTGDTPQNARLAMLKHPPHILITTPESLYLMLTGPRAREMFRTVRTVIVDEIHTMCGNKRGVHLSLSLERLQHIADQPVQRLGLSATQRPLEEVARFLGGQTWVEGRLAPRPVTIVDAGYQKPLDLQVLTVVPDFRALPGQSIWPHVVPHLAELIRQHRTTLIFCNNRRLAERTAERLNEQLALEAEGKVERGSAAALAPGGVPRGVGFAALGRSGGPIRAHHGSISKEARREMEEDLKAGRLPALVGTSSLELGIDIGSVDLVVQLQSPKAVAQGLQRVGRSGHLVGQTSVGRIFATHREDVMEAAAVARGMLRGDVEATRTPQDCLDVLAQQIVAMASVEAWSVPALYDLVRQSYAYRDLSPRVFRSVLEMLAGKYYASGGRDEALSRPPFLTCHHALLPETVGVMAGHREVRRDSASEVALHRELRPRIAWDRVHDTIAALPGSRLLAVTNAGTIPDRGAFGAYLADGKTKIGELDEEFIFETRPGDVFVLGTHTWRVQDITTDRVIVADAAGSLPRMPFWRGDYPWREYELGLAVGRFRREVAERISEFEFRNSQSEIAAVLAWLRQECALDENSAYNVLDYVRTQMEAVGAISSDRTIVVESFQDAVGDRRMVVHSPFGGRVNGPWGLALASALRERTGVEAEVQTNDDGILLRFPGTDIDLPLDIVQNMTVAEARERILHELPNSAVFGAQFRMNAARALLLPGRKGGKRTPFWLQRLKAKDLLAVTRQFADFPIVAETYRDCLRDVMDLAHLEEVLDGIAQGHIRVVAAETAVPSPVAAGLLFNFISVYMYEGDTPKSEKQLAALSLHPELLQDLLKDVPLASLLKPEAFAETAGWLQHTAPASRARSLEELALLLDDLGDLSAAEVAARCSGDAGAWLASLAEQGRAAELDLPTAQGPARRWLPTELVGEYAAAFDLPISPSPLLPVPLAEPARLAILRRFLAHSGPVTTDDIRRRYAFPTDWLSAALEELAASRQIAQGQFLPPPLAGEGPGERLRVEWLDRRNLEQIHRRTITILRKEVQPVSLFAYADFLAHWQHLHPRERLAGAGGLTRVLQQLRAAPVPGLLWERDVLPARLSDFATDGAANLEAMCQSGELVWIGSGGKDPRRSRVRFFFRGEGGLFLEAQPSPETLADLSAEGRTAWECLQAEGASFFADLEVATGLESKTLEAALVELVMAGLVTNDTLQAMREVVAFGGAGLTAPPRPLSALEVQLAERREALGLPYRPGALARPSRSRYAEAKRRVSERLQAERRWVGRWSLVHRPGVLGKTLPEEERAVRQARQLLARYGVVTRHSLEREEGVWAWEALYSQLQLLELRGEVRRGYFIAGLPGVQFALPEAVERLRASAAAQPGPADEELVVLNACDPANVFGSEIAAVPPHPTLPVDGEGTGVASAGVATFRFARLPSTYIVLWRGQPILLAEDSGARLSTTPGSERELLRRAVEALLTWLPRRTLPHRLTVSEWNGEPVLGSDGQPLLESLDFYRDLPGMTWESR